MRLTTCNFIRIRSLGMLCATVWPLLNIRKMMPRHTCLLMRANLLLCMETLAKACVVGLHAVQGLGT